MLRPGGFFSKNRDIGPKALMIGVLNMRDGFGSFFGQWWIVKKTPTRLGTNDPKKASDSLVRCDVAGRAETFGLCMLQGTILLLTRSIGTRSISDSWGPISLTKIYAMYRRKDFISWNPKEKKLWISTGPLEISFNFVFFSFLFWTLLWTTLVPFGSSLLLDRETFCNRKLQVCWGCNFPETQIQSLCYGYPLGSSPWSENWYSAATLRKLLRSFCIVSGVNEQRDCLSRQILSESSRQSLSSAANQITW